MNEICYVSDLLLRDLVGGGELNDHELCLQLNKKGISVSKKRSHEIRKQNLKQDVFYIISNFIRLDEESLNYIKDNCKYIIYEHDHKYLRSRNPALYKDYKAPESELINLEFYKKAKKVFCQTSFHETIIKQNTGLANLYNVSGNLWSDDSLDIIKFLSKKEKRDCYSILNSKIQHKNTSETIYYCDKKGYKYDLISSQDYQRFLSMLANNNKFIFLPKTPETLSRIVVEARMMNVKTITNKRVGAAHESWFHLKGEDLIEFMIDKKEEITNKIIEVMSE